MKSAIFQHILSFKIYGFLGIFLLSAWSYGFAQDSNEITEKDRKEQEEVLKLDSANFGAHYVIGAYYYNQAVDPHQKASKMKLTEYLENGKSLEEEKAGYLKKALPYFENAYAIKNDHKRIKDVLKNIYQQLGMLPTARVTPGELNSMFADKLEVITFKDLSE